MPCCLKWHLLQSLQGDWWPKSKVRLCGLRQRAELFWVLVCATPWMPLRISYWNSVTIVTVSTPALWINQCCHLSSKFFLKTVNFRLLISVLVLMWSSGSGCGMIAWKPSPDATECPWVFSVFRTMCQKTSVVYNLPKSLVFCYSTRAWTKTIWEL